MWLTLWHIVDGWWCKQCYLGLHQALNILEDTSNGWLQAAC